MDYYERDLTRKPQAGKITAAAATSWARLSAHWPAATGLIELSRSRHRDGPSHGHGPPVTVPGPSRVAAGASTCRARAAAARTVGRDWQLRAADSDGGGSGSSPSHIELVTGWPGPRAARRGPGPRPPGLEFRPGAGGPAPGLIRLGVQPSRRRPELVTSPGGRPNRHAGGSGLRLPATMTPSRGPASELCA